MQQKDEHFKRRLVKPIKQLLDHIYKQSTRYRIEDKHVNYDVDTFHQSLLIEFVDLHSKLFESRKEDIFT